MAGNKKSGRKITAEFAREPTMATPQPEKATAKKPVPAESLERPRSESSEQSQPNKR